MKLILLKGGLNNGIQIINDIIKGQFHLYFISSEGLHILAESAIEKFKFPKSEKESRFLNWIKFNELELYNKIQWY